MSSWMLLTFIPGGGGAWLGFLVIGIVGRMPRWAVTGAAIGVAAIVAQLENWGQFQPVASAIVYILGMLLALRANPTWLRTMWTRRTPRAQADRSPTRAASGTRRNTSTRASAPTSGTVSAPASVKRQPKAKTQAAKLADSAGASTSEFFATTPETVAAEPVDVNTGDVDQLASLPGMTRMKARSVIKQRDKQGGFAHLDAFATAANLRPHHIVQLKTSATCSPPARGPRAFGRRVDY